MKFNYKLITKTYGTFPNIWKQNDILLNNACVKEETQREVRKYFF